MSGSGSVHEPRAELAGVEDAVRDAARLRELLRQRKPERVVSIHVPLWALLEAIDVLEPQELKQVARRAQERLMTVGKA